MRYYIIFYIDRRTGEFYNDHITIQHSKLLTPFDAREAFYKLYESISPDIEVIGVQQSIWIDETQTWVTINLEAF